MCRDMGHHTYGALYSFYYANIVRLEIRRPKGATLFTSYIYFTDYGTVGLRLQITDSSVTDSSVLTTHF